MNTAIIREFTQTQQTSHTVVMDVQNITKSLPLHKLPSLHQERMKIMKASLYFNYTSRSLLRGGQRTILAVFCVTVGVMAVVALQLVGFMLQNSISTNARVANGGDITVAWTLESQCKNGPAKPGSAACAHLTPTFLPETVSPAPTTRTVM